MQEALPLVETRSCTSRKQRVARRDWSRRKAKEAPPLVHSRSCISRPRDESTTSMHCVEGECDANLLLIPWVLKKIFHLINESIPLHPHPPGTSCKKAVREPGISRNCDWLSVKTAQVEGQISRTSVRPRSPRPTVFYKAIFCLKWHEHFYILFITQKCILSCGMWSFIILSSNVRCIFVYYDEMIPKPRTV